MWKKYVLFLVFFFISALAYADNYSYPVDDYPENTYQDNQVSESYPKISQMERKLYNKVYDNEDIYKRLQRLESKLYNKTYDDVDLSDRVDKIASELQMSSMPGYLLRDIASLEKANFDKVYSKDNPESRLERLEYHLIGATQPGDYANRVYQLKNLTTQNGISNYLDTSNADITGLEPTKVNKTMWQPVQNVLYFIAPLLFGLL